jgi:hypothetical protein
VRELDGTVMAQAEGCRQQRDAEQERVNAQPPGERNDSCEIIPLSTSSHSPLSLMNAMPAAISAIPVITAQIAIR